VDILNMLKDQYHIVADRLEQLRDGGSTSYAVSVSSGIYFLRVVKPAFFDTAFTGVDVHVYL